ncbi:3-oxoacyl-[acyl-carrier protein] reductase [Paraburkholderia caribensis MBA4]|uniref:3-oxoacyl-[acyl-carrier protein] reductase n=1 Tax=Paraburkholderia caribensis MBA4 TaxID=1323664 RepID=A0A0P0RI40_9BURK|nr:SDR family oxidoreductase [Paraburkholderia caribensis]ALL68392.1 3-oxoacyl-[acyl-carrier protein] reductase [Paraburkholderia caribensis MBA4]
MSKVALVTGATRGIGAAIASRLAADGYDVVGIARHAKASFPGKFYECDLDDTNNSQKVLAEICREHEVSVVVNNVGAVKVQNAGDITVEALSQQWRVNVEGSVLAIQAALPTMKAQGFGRVINISSGAFLGKAGRTGYSASKAALIGLTRTLAIELGPLGITVNCVAPGQIATETWAANNDPESPKTKAMIETIPRRRLGKVEDVAGAVGYFASPAAEYVTGQTLFVCGGLTVGKSQA